MLNNGNNCMAALLNPGWYTGFMTYTTSNFNFFGDNEALLAKLVVCNEDGSKEIFVTNRNTWKVYKDGPIRFGSFFHGERYDANKEALTENWTKPEYNDSHWQSPDIISNVIGSISIL